MVEIITRPAEAVQLVQFWPDHFLTQTKKFLISFNQCMVEKVIYIVNSGNSLQHASDNRRSMVSYTGLESCIAMQV